MPTLLAYFAAALVLYGISRGGQSSFTGTRDHARIRRSIGALGALLAICAAALAVFAVAGAFRHPTLVRALVVVVPMTLMCWVLGVESSRFVVPGHGRQLELATMQLTSVRTRIDRLPRPVPLLRHAVTALAVRVVIFGFAGGAAGVLHGVGPAVAGAFVAVVFAGLAIGVFVGVTSACVVEVSRWKRLWTILGGYVLYLCLALLGVLNLLTVAPRGWWIIAGALVAQLLLHLGFRRRPFPESWTVFRRNVSLRGTLIAVEGASLLRRARSLETRIRELRAAASTSDTSAWARLGDALRTVLGAPR